MHEHIHSRTEHGWTAHLMRDQHGEFIAETSAPHGRTYRTSETVLRLIASLGEGAEAPEAPEWLARALVARIDRERRYRGQRANVVPLPVRRSAEEGGGPWAA